jgi:hypothetical protein
MTVLDEFQRHGDTLASDEWEAIVPDLEEAVGVIKSVDLEGADLPDGDIEKLLMIDADDLITEAETIQDDVSDQRKLLDAFESINI